MLQLAKDLMHPSLAMERIRHKKKRLVQSPNSYFMDVKCTGCYRITTIFSHSQTVVPCAGCSLVLCQPRGGKCRLTEENFLSRNLPKHHRQQIGPWINESELQTS
uniref:40S ribosomal protein S27 n=1 Tax=Dicentrarchus labrax TaxID=13489 RepID=A0A8P4K290_DICLA